MGLQAYNTVAWGLLKGYPWWPVYVFDPSKLRPDLYHLGSAHQHILAQAKAEPQKWRIVYYFASYDFGLHSAAQLKAWGGKDHETLKAGYPATSCIEVKVVEQFLNALREVEDYLTTDEAERTLPYIIPSDLDPRLSPPRPDVIDLADSDEDEENPPVAAARPSYLDAPPPPTRSLPATDDAVLNVPYNSLAWVRPQGLPWWPVYVCDPSHLREDLHHLGRNHIPLLTRARNEPNDHRLVYYFGRYVFGLLKMKLKPWNCSEHSVYESGHPNDMFEKRVELIEEFATALAEAKACFQNGRTAPIIPYLEASDLQKSLPAPPPLVVPVLSLGWTSKDGFPWLPVFVLDANSVNPVLHHLGNKHAQGLQEVLANPNELRLVYIFGCHEIVSRPNSAVKPWLGPEHTTCLKGLPKTVKSVAALDTLAKAIEEATNFGKANPHSRRLPFMNKEDIQYRRQDVPSARPQPVAMQPLAATSAPRASNPPAEANNAPEHSKHAGSLFWIKPINQPWWPVYLCDPKTFQSTLHYLGNSHAPHLAKAKANSTQNRLVYYLGRHVFGLHKAYELQPWGCPNHAKHLNAPPLPGNSDEENAEFTAAISEALRFVESRKLKYLTPNDLDTKIRRPEKPVIPYNSLAWVLREGFPWMPVYVCDPRILKPTLTELGNAHAPHLENAKRKPGNYRLVYYFGTNEFGLHRAKGVFRTWLGPDHSTLVDGLPRSMFINKHGREWRSKNPFMFTIFAKAMKEVADFVAQAPSKRMLPHLSPSDFTTTSLPFVEPKEDEHADHRSDSEEYSNESGDDGDHGIHVDEDISDDEIQVKPATGQYDAMVWSLMTNVLWLPAYLCDPFKLRSKVDTFGAKYVEMLRSVRAAPDEKRLVYFFGAHCFGVRRPSDMVKPWNCPEHDQFMQLALEENADAWDEAEAYALGDPATRLLPGFAESDMRRTSSGAPSSSDEEDEGSEQDALPVATTAKKPDPPAAKNAKKPVRPREFAPRPPSPKRPKPAQAPTDPRVRVPLPPQPPPPAKKRAESAAPLSPPATLPSAKSPVHLPTKPSRESTSSGARAESSSLFEGSRSAQAHPAVERARPARREDQIAQVPIQDIPLNSLAWARINDAPWWPVYVCDPAGIQPTLKYLGTRHRRLLATATQYPQSLRLVYVFGSSPSFDVCSKNMTRWDCPEYNVLLRGHPAHAIAGRVVRDFAKAKFHGTDAYTRLLPEMAESDMPRHIPLQVPPSSVAWAKSGDNEPWLPVFLCDHNALDPSEQNLGKINARLMRIVEENPGQYRIVYYFGTRHFGVLKPKSVVKWWNCPEHAQYAAGYPSDLNSTGDVPLAVTDAQAFLASDRLSNPVPFDHESEHQRLRQYEARTAPTPASRSAPAPAPRSSAAATTPTPSSPVVEQQKVHKKTRRGRRKKQVPPTDPATIVGVPTTDVTTWTSNAQVSWAKINGYPWWPSYVCDPNKLRDDLVLLGNGHRKQLEIARLHPTTHKLLYYFGSNNFGLHAVDPAKPQAVIKPWHCEDLKLYRAGYPIKMGADSKEIAKELKDAVVEAEAFLAEEPSLRLLPYMVPSDMDLTLVPPQEVPIPLNAMAWALSDSYPWMPVFVCDPDKLPCDVQNMSNQHQKMLARAKAKPGECWLVYYFGAQTFALHKIRGTIKLWDCREQENFLRGYSESTVLADDACQEFAKAMAEAKDFMAKDEATRVLPGMEPSSPLKEETQVDAIDLTLSPQSTAARPVPTVPDLLLNQGVVQPPQSSNRREIRSGIRHHRTRVPARREGVSSAPGNGDETASDDDLHADKSVRFTAKQTKRAIDVVNSRKTPDDFKYNPAQRQVLQAIEVKAEDKVVDVSVPRSKRHKASAEVTVGGVPKPSASPEAPLVTPTEGDDSVAPRDDHVVHEVAEATIETAPAESPAGHIDLTDDPALPSALPSDNANTSERSVVASDPDGTVEDFGAATAQQLQETNDSLSPECLDGEGGEDVAVGAPVEETGVVVTDRPNEDETQLAADGVRRVMWAFVDGLRWWPVHPVHAAPRDSTERNEVEVVHFGTLERSIQSWDALRPWRCADHGTWVATAATEDGSVAGLFTEAMEEAEEYLESGEMPANLDQSLAHAEIQDEPNTVQYKEVHGDTSSGAQVGDSESTVN